MDSPLINILLFAGAIYLFKIWLDDLKSQKTGSPNPKALPGAYASSIKWVIIAAIGAVGITLVETAGEIQLGVSDEQSTIPAYFILAMIGAGIIEEVVFRGYLVIENKGKIFLVTSIIGFSLLFSLGHYQYYTTEAAEGAGIMGYTFQFEAKSLWTLLLLFINSLWFYSVRFLPFNPTRSLAPCFAAHIASNLSVFVIKAIQGHVTWF